MEGKRFIPKEELRKHALAFLREQDVAAFATVSDDGPRVATVYYHTDDDLNFYIFSLRDSHKVLDLEKDPSSALAVGFGPARITVQARGKAKIIETIDADIFFEKLEALGEEGFEDWPIVELARRADQNKEEFVLIEFTPEWLSFLNFDLEGHPESFYHNHLDVIP